MRPATLAALTALALTACAPSERRHEGIDSGVDASLLPPDASLLCYPTTTVAEVALQIQIEESCAIWNSLSGLGGNATITRNGTSLTIDFGDGVVFAGTVTNGVVTLVYAHPHEFSDGCGWRATETLSGQLDPMTCDFVLTYEYVEAVVINRGGCATPCAAEANVSLELTPIIL
jgi:hypothetical protein